jgi:hypothetical protein
MVGEVKKQMNGPPMTLGNMREQGFSDGVSNADTSFS